MSAAMHAARHAAGLVPGLAGDRRRDRRRGAGTGPVAVLHANRVVACSEAARADGVRRGLRRREAQSRCPQLVVVDHDPGRDARAFEPVVAAVEEVAVGVEVIRPGACALAARGPARYFGGEEAAAERIVEQVAQACAVESQVGVADGVFAAGLAARAGRIVAPGRTRRSSSPAVPVEALDRPELTDLLRRLGHAYPRATSRRCPPPTCWPGSGSTRRWRTGWPRAATTGRSRSGRPPPDLDVDRDVRRAAGPGRRGGVRRAGAGRAAARRGSPRTGWPAPGSASRRSPPTGRSCTGSGGTTALLTAAAIADRVRWQLDGWLRTPAPARRSAPPGRPPGIVAAAADPRRRPRPRRAAAGPVGRRGRRARTRPPGAEPGAGHARPGGGGDRGARRRPLAGRPGARWCRGATSATPAPAGASRRGPAGCRRPRPPLVLPQPLPAAVCSTPTGAPVGVSARLELSAAAGPARRSATGAGRSRSPAGPGPWPVDERWWAPARRRRRARFQVGLADGRALLLSLAAGHWAVEAIYD